MALVLSAAALRQQFGIRSDAARRALPVLLRQTHAAEASTLSQRANDALNQLGRQLKLPDATPEAILAALRCYFTGIALLLAAEHVRQRCGTIWDWSEVCQGDFFGDQGITNLSAPLEHRESLRAWSPPTVSIDTSGLPPTDALKGLYLDLIPREVRHTTGEYYTPDWLAEHTLDRLGYTGKTTLLDPACGSGTFLALAMRRIQKHGNGTTAIRRLAGIDINPYATLAARVTLLLALDSWHHGLELPVYTADTLLDDLNLEPFDNVVGNPPWVNWEALPESYRERSRQLWQDYGLFTHRGMAVILGKGKKDLSALFTLVVADRYLRPGGRLAFLLTESVFKAGGANAGLRRMVARDVPLAALHVDDFSGLRVFDGTETRAALLVLERDRQTVYPVPYTLWKQNGHRLNMVTTLDEAYAHTQRHALAAEPIDPAQPGSPWLSAPNAALHALRKLRGQSAYRAYTGVYTGGANGVYWLEVLGRHGELLHVRNHTQNGKRDVPQVEALIEAELVYPLLRGRDVQRWRAQPSAHILIVQDATTRHGYLQDWLQTHYPHTYAYLTQFESLLRQRAAYKRFFRSGSAFYSMFDVGKYSFAPIKVVWQGMGVRMMQAVVVTAEADRPVMSNQAMHPFIPFEDETEAHYVAACLNSAVFGLAVLSHTQAGGKSFAQPGLMQRLFLPAYDPSVSLHRALAELSRRAHAQESLAPIELEINNMSSELWHLTRTERQAVRNALELWA